MSAAPVERAAPGAAGDAPTGRRHVGWPVWFALLSVIWGLSFLFIKVGDEALAPIQVAFGRMVCGTGVLVVVLTACRQRLPAGWRTWGHLAVAALLLNAAPFSLFAYGETDTSSVMAGILNATTPLFVLPVAAVIVPAERLTRSRLVGLVIGFIGVITVLGAWHGLGGGHLGGDLRCLGGAGCYGLGFPYARRYLSGRADPLSLATGQLLCGTIELAAVTPLLSGLPAALPVRVVLSVVALGAAGTGLAYVLSFTVIRDAGATTSSTVTYVIPIFSTLAGVVILKEPLSWTEPLGAAVIVVGALMTQDRLHLRFDRRRTQRRPRGPAESPSSYQPSVPSQLHEGTGRPLGTLSGEDHR